MELWTQYTYEKKWTITTQKEALKMIEKEMTEADAKGTFDYILTEIKKGRIITLGECRFKIENKTPNTI